jgi:hypothetical protein
MPVKIGDGSSIMMMDVGLNWLGLARSLTQRMTVLHESGKWHLWLKCWGVQDEKHRNVFRRQWLAKQVTLNLVAPLLAQEFVLLLCLDAFCNHRESQCLTHVDDGRRNGAVFRALREVADEGSIDFDRIDGKFFHQGH